MSSERNAGRVVGLLLFLHLAVGLMSPFILIDLVRRSGGLLVNAARHPGQVRAAVLLLFAGSAIAIGVAATAWTALRQRGPAPALWLFALAVAGFSLQAVDNTQLLSLLSLSQEYARADGARRELVEALGLVAGSARRWAHYSYLLVLGGWMVLLFATLYRFRLVPPVLAAAGIAGSLLQMTGVTLRGLLGYAPETRLAMPLAPIYAAIAVWLMARGFAEGTGSREAEAPVGSPARKRVPNR